MRKWTFRALILGIVGVGLVYGGILLWTKVINKPEERFDSEDLAGVVSVSTTFANLTTTTIASPNDTNDSGSTTDNDITGRWTITDGSEVGYRVKEVLGGVDTEGVGRTDDVSGIIDIQGTSITDVTFEVRVATITSDSNRRDSQFAGPIMETSVYPTATFQLTQPIELETIPASGTTIDAVAVGELTLHGVTREVTFDVSARIDNGIIGVLGSIEILFSDYEIDNPSNGFVTTGDTGLIEFILAFTR